MKGPPSDPVSTHSHPQPARSRDRFAVQQMVLQSLSLCCEKLAPWGLRTGSSSRMCFCLLVALILETLREVIQTKGLSSLTGPRGSEADEPLVSGTAGPRPALGPC